MDEEEIFLYVKSCKHLKFKFRGVFAADNFPLAVPCNSFLIVNTSQSKFPGTHWVFLGTRSNSKQLYYADPLGFPLQSYQQIMARVAKTGFSSFVDLLNDQPIQDKNSQLCGLYCIYIAHHFFNKIIPSIVAINDVQLISFIKHMQ